MREGGATQRDQGDGTTSDEETSRTPSSLALPADSDSDSEVRCESDAREKNCEISVRIFLRQRATPTCAAYLTRTSS